MVEVGCPRFLRQIRGTPSESSSSSRSIAETRTPESLCEGVGDFGLWCADRGILALGEVRPFQLATYIEGLQAKLTAPSVKQHLAAIRIRAKDVYVQGRRHDLLVDKVPHILQERLASGGK
jgi:hypothetical protein